MARPVFEATTGAYNSDDVANSCDAAVARADAAAISEAGGSEAVHSGTAAADDAESGAPAGRTAASTGRPE